MAHTLRYNENKVKKGKAECLLAENFLKDTDKLSYKNKLAYFKRVIAMNSRPKANTIHAFLNFYSSENLPDSKMVEIAKSYMQKIGLGHQPFLVYRHHDALHPHIHLVSTPIQRDGKSIKRGPIFRYGLNQAAREIEESFSLQKPSLKLFYEDPTIMEGMHNVLHKLVNDYKFTSLNEMNAILSIYKIRADRGKEGSKMYQRRGLVYYSLDEKGNNQGRPIRSSSFYFKPTLSNLERKFALDESERQPHSERIKQAIDWTLLSRPHDQDQLQKALEKERINTIYQRDKEGVLQGVFFVDQQSRSVFDGAALGTRYSAQSIRERCTEKQSLTQHETQRYRHRLM